MRWSAWFLVGALCWAAPALAYTSAGDRAFSATLLLPQIAPTDEIYVKPFTLPQPGGAAGAARRNTNLGTTYAKTITDRLGVSVEQTFSRVDRIGAGALTGWQNLDLEAKYMAVNDIPREFLLTLGLDRETGGTGARRVGAAPSGATTPRIYFGKGAGDLEVGLLRPLALVGFAGVQLADAAPRPNLVTGGIAVQYSLPYLQSKVGNFDLPWPLRAMSPVTEIVFTAPAGRSFGARATVLIAPGISLAGEGWEFAVAALLPTSRATGRGVGVIAQFHLSLDFLLADSIGKPLFSEP